MSLIKHFSTKTSLTRPLPSQPLSPEPLPTELLPTELLPTEPLPTEPLPTAETLPIVETFHSVQGEGFWTGVSAFFIRLAGCDVGCTWCDTKHAWPMAHHPQKTVDSLVKKAVAAKPFMVVITGGEPLMHDLNPLTQHLREAGLRVHLETSGAHPLSGTFDWISLSPKRFKPPLEDSYTRADELKVVIKDSADLAWAAETASKVADGTVKLLQPCWTISDDNRGPQQAPQQAPQQTPQQAPQQLVFDYVLSHPDWRVGLQTHKFLGVR
ncbi:MAG: radical SAM protein [Cyanobacteria bacterium J06560_5]